MQTPFITLFFIILFSGVSQAQGSFIMEEGGQIALSPGVEVPCGVPGALMIPFSFQSSEYDATTGQFIQPDLKASYMLLPPGASLADCLLAQYDCVFGEPGFWPTVVVSSFSNSSGFGNGKAYLPIGLQTEAGSWSDLFIGINQLTLYWGTTDGLIHDGFSPPIQPMGQLTVDVPAQILSEILVFHENKAMMLDVETFATLIVPTASVDDRVFSLSCTVQNGMLMPAQVTLPAGDASVSFAITPRELGDTRIVANEIFTIPAAGNTVASAPGKVKRPKNVKPENYEPPPVGPREVIRQTSDCTHASAYGHASGGATTRRAGPCKRGISQPSDCSMGFAVDDGYIVLKPYSCDWWSWAFHTCEKTAGGVELNYQVWKLKSTRMVGCGSKTEYEYEWDGDVRDPGDRLTESTTRIFNQEVCVFEATDRSRLLRVDDCQ